MTHTEPDNPHVLASAQVVVGVDGSKGSELALRWAAHHAARHGRALQIVNGVDLVGMSTVTGPYSVITPSLVDAAREHSERVLRQAAEIARSTEPGLRVETRSALDGGAGLLIERSREAFAVVLGATGNSGTLAHLGSTLLAVTAHARGTVIVVRPDAQVDNEVRESGPVVVGVDGSPVSEPAIAAAFNEAAMRGVALVVVHVWSDWDLGAYFGDNPGPVLEDVEAVEAALVSERLAGWQEKYPEVEVIPRVYVNAPARHLQQWSADAQLVVVGNRGRGGFLGLLLGSTSHALVQHARCPVMVVHAER